MGSDAGTSRSGGGGKLLLGLLLEAADEICDALAAALVGQVPGIAF